MSIPNNQGDTMCHVALQKGHVEFTLAAADICPQIVFVPNRLGDTLPHTAFKHGRLNMIVDHPSGSFPFRDLLRRCLESHQKDVTSFARREGTFVKREGASLIYLAAERGYSDVVSHLLRLPGDLRLLSKYMPLSSGSRSFPEDLRECFEMDRVDGPNGSTALHVSVREGKPDVIRMLMKHRKKLSEQQDRNGQTPLHLAVTMEDPKLVEILIDANAYSAYAPNKDGISPFHLAANLDNLEIFQLFLRLYPDCYMGITSRRQNALHIAVQHKSAGIVDYVVEDKKLSEFLINQQDEDDNTPLQVAASNGDDKMLNALLASSAKVLPLKNIEGLTYDGVAKAHEERKNKEKREKMQRKWVKVMEDLQNSLLVMTTLITTVTFTAAFTLPGGYNGDDPNRGMATLVGRAGFDVFLISSTISMSFSIITTAALIGFSVVFSLQQRFNTLKMIVEALGISIIFMLFAFASGVWLVVGSQRRWLAIIIAILIACTPLLLIFLVAPIIAGFGKEED